jgi:DNA polymerase V
MEKRENETGFPSPAQGYEAKSFDFNQILVKNPAATFVMELASSEMIQKGLYPGTLLIVDRSVKPRSGSLVVLCHNGEFLCREMIKSTIREFKTIVFTDGEHEIPSAEDIEIFGTVTCAVRQL